LVKDKPSEQVKILMKSMMQTTAEDMRKRLFCSCEAQCFYRLRSLWHCTCESITLLQLYFQLFHIAVYQKESFRSLESNTEVLKEYVFRLLSRRYQLLFKFNLLHIALNINKKHLFALDHEARI